MSSERIRYDISPMGLRIIALVIDFIVVAILTGFFQFGVYIEWDLFWEDIFQIDFSDVALLLLFLMLILSILIYFILVPSFTDGQTVGKMLMGLYVLYDDNSSTKREFVTHIKRLFFIRKGTKVCKVVDERPEGL